MVPWHSRAAGHDAIEAQKQKVAAEQRKLASLMQPTRSAVATDTPPASKRVRPTAATGVDDSASWTDVVKGRRRRRKEEPTAAVPATPASDASAVKPAASAASAVKPAASPPSDGGMEVDVAASEAAVDQALEVNISRSIVMGPDPATLLRIIEAPVPALGVNEDETSKSRMLEQLRETLSTAQNDVLASRTLSQGMQKIAAEHERRAEEALRKAEDEAGQSKAQPPATFAIADRWRANAVSRHASWIESVARKQKHATGLVSDFIQALDSTMDALRSQRELILSAQQSHTLAWARKNEAISAQHDSEIAKLEAHCQRLQPAAATALLVASEVPLVIPAAQETLQSTVLDLRAQLESQRQLLCNAETNFQAQAAMFAEATATAEAKYAALLAQVQGTSLPAAVPTIQQPSSEEDRLFAKGKGGGKGAAAAAAAPGDVLFGSGI